MKQNFTSLYAVLYYIDQGWKVYGEYDKLDEALDKVLECISTMHTGDVKVIKNIEFQVKTRFSCA